MMLIVSNNEKSNCCCSKSLIVQLCALKDPLGRWFSKEPTIQSPQKTNTHKSDNFIISSLKFLHVAHIKIELDMPITQDRSFTSPLTFAFLLLWRNVCSSSGCTNWLPSRSGWLTIGQTQWVVLWQNVFFSKTSTWTWNQFRKINVSPTTFSVFLVLFDKFKWRTHCATKSSSSSTRWNSSC